MTRSSLFFLPWNRINPRNISLFFFINDSRAMGHLSRVAKDVQFSTHLHKEDI